MYTHIYIYIFLFRVFCFCFLLFVCLFVNMLYTYKTGDSSHILQVFCIGRARRAREALGVWRARSARGERIRCIVAELDTLLDAIHQLNFFVQLHEL